MTFLEKFKGKTTLLNKLQVKQILGQKTEDLTQRKKDFTVRYLKPSSQSNKNHKNSQLFTANSDWGLKKTKKSLLRNEKVKQVSLDPENNSQIRKVIQNPFLVQNQFFLGEQQYHQTLKLRKQKQISDKIEKQKKKRQQIEQIMMKSLQKSANKNIKYTKKQWVKMGGLGPNIGGEQWTKKKGLHQKMIKFAQEVKNNNKLHNQQQTKIQRSQSLKTEKTNKKSTTSRDLAIKYSKTVQKPSSFIFQKTKQKQPPNLSILQFLTK